MRRKHLAGILIIAACLTPLLSAEKAFWASADAYLGQAPPSDTPKIFAPGLLTDSGTFVMGRVAFSHDGKEFYYTQCDSWNSAEHARIKAIRYAGHHWGKPAVVAEQFLTPTLSIDGTAMYMRRGNMHNVWQSVRTGASWGSPTPLMEKPYAVYDFMPTISGNYYVGSDPSREDVRNGSTLVYSVLTISNGDVTVKSLGTPA